MASELELEMHRLNNQARFVQMIVNKELVVSNRKKADIVAELRKLDFRPFSKVSKAKKAGETEELVEINDDENEDEDEGKDTDYDYLLGMAIWSLTKEKVSSVATLGNSLLTFDLRLPNSLRKRKRRSRNCWPSSKSLRLHCGRRTSIGSWPTGRSVYTAIWLCNCSLTFHLQATCAYWEDKVISADSASKKGKRKQATLKQMTKKARGSDDSEDEFKPTKAKAKKPESKSVAKKATQAGPSGSKAKLENDDADDIKPPLAPAKKATKKAIKDESDSDFEIGQTKAAPLKKAAARKAAKKEEDDDFEIIDSGAVKADDGNDSDVEVIPPPSKDKGKGKAAASKSTSKRKR